MTKLKNALSNWGKDSFSQALKDELQNLAPGVLPLHKVTTQGGIVDDSDISVSVINVVETAENIQSKVGVFFTEIVGGCSCGDEPLAANAYGELLVTINRQNAEAEFCPVDE